MNLFFLQKDSHGQFFLDETESRHCIKVLRHQLHDKLEGIDGLGNKYSCRITAINSKKVLLEIQETVPGWGEKPQEICLAVSPLRQRDRFEWAIEKAVELGVTRIQPLLCKRTIKTGFKLQRMESIALSALKQCKRSRMPDILEPMLIADYLDTSPKGMKLIGWCESSQPIQGYHDRIKSARAVHLLIGPEGDFSEEEVNMAKESGFLPLSLGENRLRTETAAIHLLGIIKYIQAW